MTTSEKNLNKCEKMRELFFGKKIVTTFKTIQEAHENKHYYTSTYRESNLAEFCFFKVSVPKKINRF